MLNVPSPIFVAVLSIIASAFLCLLLEATGIKEGFNKIGNKPHIALLTFLTVIAVGIYLFLSPLDTPSNPTFCFDKTAKIGIVFAALITIFCLSLGMIQTRDMQQEKGEYYALLLISFLLVLVLCIVKDVLYFTICASLWTLCMTALCVFNNSPRLEAEVAAKIFMKATFWLIVMAIASSFAYASSHATQLETIAQAIADPTHTTLAKCAWSLIWIGALSFFGMAPFFWFHVDYLDGASSFPSTAFAIGILIPGSIMILRLIDASFQTGPSQDFLLKLLWFFAALSLIAPGLLAIDQQRIGRMCIYLLMLQPGIWLTLVLSTPKLAIFESNSLFLFLCNIAMSIPGMILGLIFLKTPHKSNMTWEDYAGAGRKYPFTVTAWLVALASLAGIPGTPGFHMREIVIQNVFATQHFLCALLILISILIAAAPIIRLSVFLFAKSAHHTFTSQHIDTYAFFILLCGIILLISGIFPELLIQLNRFFI